VRKRVLNQWLQLICYSRTLLNKAQIGKAGRAQLEIQAAQEMLAVMTGAGFSFIPHNFYDFSTLPGFVPGDTSSGMRQVL
jgi:hypothetical protein